MIAIKRLQNLFWIMVVTAGALAAYLVTQSVAMERAELMSVRTRLAATQADIRYLETEFLARASMRQLERWNADDLRYAAPHAQQYLTGPTAFAMLDRAQPGDPGYVAPPVMASMVAGPQDTPRATVDDAVASPAVAQISEGLAIVRPASAATIPDTAIGKAKVASEAHETVTGRRINPIAQRAERMAMLDAQLLDDRTLGEIKGRAATETGKGVR